jgi:hypothetical protein
LPPSNPIPSQNFDLVRVLTPFWASSWNVSKLRTSSTSTPVRIPVQWVPFDRSLPLLRVCETHSHFLFLILTQFPSLLFRSKVLARRSTVVTSALKFYSCRGLQMLMNQNSTCLLHCHHLQKDKFNTDDTNY